MLAGSRQVGHVMVVLDEIIVESGFGKSPPAVCFEEKAPIIGKNLRLDDNQPGDAGL